MKISSMVTDVSVQMAILENNVKPVSTGSKVLIDNSVPNEVFITELNTVDILHFLLTSLMSSFYIRKRRGNHARNVDN